MTVVIPGMNLDHDRVEIRPRNVCILQCYTDNVLTTIIKEKSSIILCERKPQTSSSLLQVGNA